MPTGTSTTSSLCPEGYVFVPQTGKCRRVIRSNQTEDEQPAWAQSHGTRDRKAELLPYVALLILVGLLLVRRMSSRS